MLTRTTTCRTTTRRRVLTTALAGGAILGAGLPIRSALAQGKRVLTIDTLASNAAINIPMQQALFEGIAEQPGFAVPTVQRNEKLTQGVQSVLAGTSDMADADVLPVLSAAEAGAKVKILGLSYNNTSQTIVVNTDRARTFEDLLKPGISVAVNSIGDSLHAVLIGALLKRGIDPAKVTVVEIGGSANRTRAMLSGKVDAATLHIEQAALLKAKGNYEPLVKPWVEYQSYYSAVVFTTDAWLAKPGNKEAALAYLKAVLISFRKTNADFNWYNEKFRKYISSKEAKTEPEETTRETWRALREDVKAWPDNMQTLSVEGFKAALPAYVAAGAIKGTVDVAQIVDRTLLDQAIAELARGG